MSKDRKKYKIFIFIPAFIACLIDLIVTVINQKPEYWLNNLHKVNEVNPTLNWAMQNHITGIFIVTFLWLIFIFFLTLYAPVKVGRIICLTIVLGNSWGAGTWISRYYGFWFVILLVVVNSTLFITFDELQRKYY